MAPGSLTESYFLELLTANQNPDGGWGFHPGTPSATEATAWAVMALKSNSHIPPQSGVNGCDWLIKNQLPNGSWPAFAAHIQGCWVTSVAGQALHLDGKSPDRVTRALNWIVAEWPAEGSVWWRLRSVLSSSHEARQDSSLRGWNWTPGTASWVEPTAHALLFLGAIPSSDLPEGAAKRQDLAERMLFDRMCPGGGWNSGNPLVYGVGGIPRTGPTAWALMALRRHANRSEIQSSLNQLESTCPRIQGAASLALAYRSLMQYGRSVPPLIDRLDQLYATHHFFENVLTMAWIALAFAAEKNASLQTGAPQNR